MLDLATALGPRARLAVVGFILFVFVGLPFGRQVLGLPVAAVPWQMYRDLNLDVCSLGARDADGHAVVWSAVLYPDRERLFPRTPRLRRGKSVQRTLKKLCRKLGPTSRYSLRCADRDAGWSTLYRFEDDACAAEAARRKKAVRGRGKR